jgi:enolase 1/2/3
MIRIDSVTSRSVPNSRGRATLETTLISGAHAATASVPSGKSTGSHEAIELRDADGSVKRTVANVNDIIGKAIVDREFASLDDLDALLIELDGTANKSRLGANAILSVSIAAQRLSSLTDGIPLWKAVHLRADMPVAAPRLYVNVMNGGVHADFRLPFQEYILVVEGKTTEALPIAEEAFAKLGERLGRGVPMGDEGGYAPSFETIDEPFEILTSLVKKFPGTSIAIDAAASELIQHQRYQLLGKTYSPHELTLLYEDLVNRYPMHSIEDPFAEEAGEDFTRLTALLGHKVLIVGDDLTVTNPARISSALARKEINAVLIKPNQIGTVRETIEAVRQTYAAGWQAIASHRSGETDDTFIADFAYGIGAHGIKAGGLGQRQRLEKYERLRAIEHEAAGM